MNASKGLILGAVVCFALAALDIGFGMGIGLVPLGLALFAAAFLVK
ncbi:MAG: hypothetical protein ACRDIU_01915 [Actinomycetota bacterium]